MAGLWTIITKAIDLLTTVLNGDRKKNKDPPAILQCGQRPQGNGQHQDANNPDVKQKVNVNQVF